MAMAAVTKRRELKEDQAVARRKIGWLMDGFRKYAVDLSVKLPTKGTNKGNLQLHRTVQEELKNGGSLKVCKDKQKSETLSVSEETTKMEKLPEEMNAMKLKDVSSAKKLEPISSNKLPPEQVKDKHSLNPTSKRIMIRSRL